MYKRLWACLSLYVCVLVHQFQRVRLCCQNVRMQITHYKHANLISSPHRLLAFSSLDHLSLKTSTCSTTNESVNLITKAYCQIL